MFAMDRPTVYYLRNISTVEGEWVGLSFKRYCYGVEDEIYKRFNLVHLGYAMSLIF